VAEFLTDSQIAALLKEPKSLPSDLANLTPALRNMKIGHKEGQYEVVDAAGNDFRVIIRQSNFNVLDFSVILAYLPKTSSQVLRLRRYNGKSHEHTNQLERVTFYGFHIHTATERYQRERDKEDGFAEVTDRYNDLAGAIDCLIEDCGFQRPENHAPRMF
jgi:hypothetical protein